MNAKLKYIVLGFMSWLIVDWATVGGFRLSYFQVPLIGHVLRFIIFLSSPLILSYLIFNRQWNNKRIFLTTLAILFIVEIPISGNSLLYTFPGLIIFIPVAIAGYSFLTFFPLWIVRKEIGVHKKKIILLSIIVIAITILSVISRSREERSSFSSSRLSDNGNAPKISEINTRGTEDQPIISLDGNRLCFLYSPIDFKLFQDTKGRKVKIIGLFRDGHSEEDVFNKKMWFKGYCSYKQNNGGWSKPTLAPHELIAREGGVYGKFMYMNDGEKIIAEAYDLKEINLGGNGDLVYFEKRQSGKLEGPFILSPYFNTRYMEQDFHITEDGKTMVFRSDNPGSLGFGDIFISHMINGDWAKPENIGVPINTEIAFEAPGWISPDKQRICFIRRYPQLWNTKKSGIYFSEQIDGRWREPVKLELGIDGDNVFAPTLTRDEKALYFEFFDSSMNNYDIYVSYKNRDGTWSAAAKILE